MRRFSSVDLNRSRYTQGGVTEKYPTRLGWWERAVFTKSDSDITIVVDQRYHHRPWLIAFDVYGDVSLEWLVLQYNDILDPIAEIVTGRELRLPSLQRLNYEILAKPIGGKSMTE